MKNTASIDFPPPPAAAALTDRRAQIAAIVANLARKMTPLYSATDPRPPRIARYSDPRISFQ